MAAKKSNNNDKPASAMEKFKPANEMSGDEMYAVALKLPNDHPYKAYLECELRKLYSARRSVHRQRGKPLFPTDQSRGEPKKILHTVVGTVSRIVTHRARLGLL